MAGIDDRPTLPQGCCDTHPDNTRTSFFGPRSIESILCCLRALSMENRDGLFDQVELVT
jgi:hypothetical protein